MDDWSSFRTTTSEQQRLRAALSSFCESQDLPEEQRAAYTAYLRKRIRPAVEMLIREDDFSKLERILQTGWLSDADRKRFLNLAADQQKWQAFHILLNRNSQDPMQENTESRKTEAAVQKEKSQKKKKRWRSGFSKKPAKISAGCTRNLVKRFSSFVISRPTGQKPSHPTVIRYILTPILYSACVPKIHRSSRKAISTCCWNASAGLGKKHRSRKKRTAPGFMADAGKRKTVSGFMAGAGKRAGTYRVFSISLGTCFPQVGGKLRHRRPAARSELRWKKETLSEIEKRAYNYRSFLKQFTVTREEMELDLDSFDPVAYHYGLEHYGSLPFIEPPETREGNRLEELVIAIDTSGSCKREIVAKFLGETRSILEEKENFFSRWNVCLIQCDSFVQDVTMIHSPKEWEAYRETITIKGRGGTDFRPVFQKVEELRKQHVFRNLKALIYFTDGDGIYPEQKPDYETAFVFVRQTERMNLVPKWAKKLLTEECTL